MSQFLPAQIDCLARQVESYGSDHATAMLCYDVEELMSLYVSLFNELERGVAKASPRDKWDQSAVDASLPVYRRLLQVGDGIRVFMRELKVKGYRVEGIEAFMSAYLRTRIASETESLVAASLEWERGGCKTRPLQELIDELQRRDDAAGGSGSSETSSPHQQYHPPQVFGFRA
jgi:hypothetical protein